MSTVFSTVFFGSFYRKMILKACCSWFTQHIIIILILSVKSLIFIEPVNETKSNDMKFKVNRETILGSMQRVQSVVGTRTTLPVLSNVLVEAKDNKVWFTTTDLEVSIRTGIDAEIEEEGLTTLPVRKVFSIFRELSGQMIEWDTNAEHTTSIRSSSSFFKIIGIADEEFPPMPSFTGEKKFSLEQGVLEEMLRNTRYAASNDETRYVLNGVLMSFKDEKLTVVATDGRRLALLEQELEFPKNAEVDLIIPGKTADELIKNLGGEGSVEIQASDNQVSFEFSDLLVVSKLIEGTYPNYMQVVPSQCEERISIERELLFTAVRRVSLLATDKSNSVRLSFLPNQIEVSAVSPQVGEALEIIPVKYKGKKISIAFNPEFLLDPLRNITSDEVAMEMTDDLSPGVLKCDLPFVYVLMPMRIS